MGILDGAGISMFVGIGGLLVPINQCVACHIEANLLRKIDEGAS